MGGRFGYIDDGETPNTQLCLFEYDAGPLMFETRGLETKDVQGVKVGNIWYCENGYVVCPSYNAGVAYDKAGKEVAKFAGGGDQLHFDNFVKAVRSRKHEELNCDIAEGHLSASLCHLANISYRLGTEQPVGKAEKVSTDKSVNEFAAGMLAHLKANKLDAEKTVGRFGPVLAIDAKTERFTNNDKANALLTREYRKGFELKDVV